MLRFAAIDTEEEHHYTSCLHHPAVIPKMMPSKGGADKAPPSSDLLEQDIEFPLDNANW
jgi:hypothetical protein